jgi:hypothetical protein
LTQSRKTLCTKNYFEPSFNNQVSEEQVLSKKFNWMPILRTGTFTDKNGRNVSIGLADLDKVVAATDINAEPQFVIEHPSFDKLGFGTIEKLQRVGSYLLALPKIVEDKFKEAVNSGKLPGRSVTIDKNNFSLKNISFLPPEVPPAVSGLGAYSFSEGEDDTLLYTLALPGVESHFADLGQDHVEFAQFEISNQPFRAIKEMFSGLREFIIDKFDMDAADKILPKWMLVDLDRAPKVYEVPDSKDSPSISANSFSLNINNEDKMPKIELSKYDLSKVDPQLKSLLDQLVNNNTALETAIAAKDTELQAATTKLTESETATLRNEVVQFCSGDDVKLKIKPAIKEKVVNFLISQKQTGNKGVIEFSTAGGNGTSTRVEMNAYEFAKELIKQLPDVISLSEIATKEAGKSHNPENEMFEAGVKAAERLNQVA